jgi:opacity protein-like surface antigen
MRMTVRVVGILALSMMIAAPAMAQDEAAPTPAAPPPAATPNPAPTPAPIPAPPGGGAFGSLGQIAISADLPLQNEAPQLAFIHSSTNMGGGSSTVFAIEPSLDYFVAPNVSIGAEVGLAYSTSTDQSGGTSENQTIIEVEARVGYDLALGDAASIWPRIGIGYTHASSSGGGSAYSVPLIISVPLLWHPGFHFFLGAGPMFETELVNKVSAGGTSADAAKTTQFGVQAIIGGYLGGT